MPVSFRILHPEPFATPASLSPDIFCAVEFPSKNPAAQLEKILLSFPHCRHVRLEKKPPYTVHWALSRIAAFQLVKVLKKFPELSSQMRKGLDGYLSEGFWVLKGRGSKKFKWDRRTQVMGILNVTPDSFSDGGWYLDPRLAVERALRLQEEGAEWVDIGGESTRPGAQAISATEEKKRVLPVVKACAKALRIPVSVDTYKAEVARAAVGEGAQMINDIGALSLDPQMGRTLARLKVPVILMHMKGKPRTMQKDPFYRDVIGEILSFFRERMDYAESCGLPAEKLLLDPGFGFGKNPWHNLEITRRLWEFKVLGRPLVLGPSRKSTLGVLLGGAPPQERVEATAAAVTAAVLHGADFVRVHDVQSMARVVKIADAIRYHSSNPGG